MYPWGASRFDAAAAQTVKAASAAIGTPISCGSISSGGPDATSCAITLSVAIAAGDLIIVSFGNVEVSSNLAVNVTCADNGGGGSPNVYTQNREDHTTASSDIHSNIISAICTDALAIGKVVTVSPVSGNFDYPCMNVSKVSGIAQSSFVDQVGGSQGTSTTPGGGAVTTTTANQLIWGVICNQPDPTITPNSGWTSLVHLTNGSESLRAWYRIEASTGTYTLGGTSTSVNYSDSVVSFKGA